MLTARCSAAAGFVVGVAVGSLFVRPTWSASGMLARTQASEAMAARVPAAAAAPRGAAEAGHSQHVPAQDALAAVATDSDGRFSGIVPLVYVWFCGDVKQEEGKLSWNTTKNCTEWTRTLRLFFITVSMSLFHVPALVLITDVEVGGLLKRLLTADVAAEISSKLHVYNYFDYVDEKFWRIRGLYEKYLHLHHGFREPFEKWNVLNFFILRSWLEKERVPAAGYAEGDVAVFVPPFLHSGCQSEIAWRDRFDVKHEWGPYTYCALASLGNVLSLDVMNDWTDFNIELYGEHRWIQQGISRFSFVQSINQMHTWYFFAMASVDYEGMNWSDGEPWYLQYIRRPPTWTRERQVMMKYDGKELPYKNATLPGTKRYRICNGFFPRDGYVLDSGHGWDARRYDCCALEGKATITLNGSKMSFTYPDPDGGGGNVTLRNLHFQGHSKVHVMNMILLKDQAVKHKSFRWARVPGVRY